MVVTTLSGWRLALALLVGALFILLIITTLVWLAVLLAVVIAVGWLNVVLLPRVARRLRVPRPVIDVACLILLAGVGWLLGGTTGLMAGAVGWLLGVAVPRLIGWRMRDRVQVATYQQRVQSVDVVDLELAPGSERWEQRPRDTETPPRSSV